MFDRNMMMAKDKSLVLAIGTVLLDIVRLGKKQATGTPKKIFAQISNTVTSSGAGTAMFELIGSASSDMSSPTVLLATAAIPVASLVAGFVIFNGYLPPNCPEYLSIRVTVATAPLTGGTLNGGVVWHTQE